MKEPFFTLCTFVVGCGLLRCFIAGTSLEKHFSMVSGIIILLVIIVGIKEFELNELSFPRENFDGQESAYDELVISKATEIIEENINTAISSRYGIACEAHVVLEQENGTYLIQSVSLSGIEETGYIRLYLADYLSVEEDAIVFA